MAKIGDATPSLLSAEEIALFNPKGPIELEVEGVMNKGDEEKIAYLLDRAIQREREDQRDDDCARDHGIRLFSRQKSQGLGRICMTLFLLTLIYLVQFVALYNLNRQSSFVDTNVLVKWLERGTWKANDARIQLNNTFDLPNQVRTVVEGSTLDIFDLKAYQFCLTKAGQLDVFFNVGIGLIMIYLFLFFDLWFVVFDMPLVHNDINETHGFVMLMGVLWLVLLNSGVITWLGVISGFSVIANSGDFYSVLFTSLQLFIVLVIDDTVLPAVRFLIEEAGNLDSNGDLLPDQLDKLTHGSQYYKPGYGHRFVKNFLSTSFVMKITSALAFIMMSTIIIAPAVTTIVFAVRTFNSC
jgi:hypothetical protein